MAGLRKAAPAGMDGFRTALVLIPCVLFCYELVGCSCFAGWDVTRLNLPLKWFDVQSLRQGELPLWNPYLFAGMPQLAESESGLFYPGNLLLHLPGDFFYWANLTIILHFVLAGLFLDLWLRGRGVDRLASFFGAVLFQTAPWLVFHISSMALMQTAVWFPLLLWMADRYLADRFPVTLCWVALLSGMLMLAGSVQMAFYEGVLVFFYLAGHVFSERENRLNRLLASLRILICMLAGALVLGAVIWIPAVEFTGTTVRESVDAAFYRLGTWLTPGRLASAFYFPAYGRQTEMVHWASSLIYVGLLPSLLALLRLFTARANWRRDAPLIVMAAAALFLAFGMNNPANHLLVKMPPFSMFRYLGRFSLGVIVGLVGLASACLSDFLSVRHLKAASMKWALALVFVSLFFFLLSACRFKAILWGGFVLLADIALTWWSVSLLRKNASPQARFPVWTAVYLVFHLLLVFPVGRLASMPAPRFREALSFFDHLHRSDGLAPRLLVIDVGRFADRDLLAFSKFRPQGSLPNLCAGNTAVFRGVQTMNPYTPMMPKAWSELVKDELESAFMNVAESGVLDEGASNLLWAMGVDCVVTSGRVRQIPGYVISDADLSLAFGPNARMFLSETEKPRVWMASRTETVQAEGTSQPDLGQMIDILSEGNRGAVWEVPSEPPRLETGEVGGLLKNVQVELDADEATVTFANEQTGWLIAEISFSGNWEVTIDGRKAETCRAVPPFYAVWIADTGEHVLRFEYRRNSVALGALVSCLGLIIAAAATMTVRRMRR